MHRTLQHTSFLVKPPLPVRLVQACLASDVAVLSYKVAGVCGQGGDIPLRLLRLDFSLTTSRSVLDLSQVRMGHYHRYVLSIVRTKPDVSMGRQIERTPQRGGTVIISSVCSDMLQDD